MKLQKPNYRAWLIDGADFPTHGTIVEQINFLIGYGVLAPSQHNTQPWQIGVNGETLCVTADPTRSLPVGDPSNRGLYISLGCFIENIVQAASAFGMKPAVSYGDRQAVVSFSAVGAVAATTTLQAIGKRSSYKKPFLPKLIDQSVSKKLKALVIQSNPNTEAQLIETTEMIKKITTIHSEAAEKVAGNQSLVLELAGWLRTNGTKSYDGMPGFTVGNTPMKSLVGKMLLPRKPALFQKSLPRDRQMMESSQLIAVWAVATDSPQALMECGRHIEAVWLKAMELGLSAHPMTATTTLPETAGQLRNALELHNDPVFLMRFGYGDGSDPKTPRRTLTS